MSDLRKLAIEYAKAFIGRPYIWGGDDPIKGFDCCIPEDELIYTLNGAKFITEIKTGEEVFSINNNYGPSISKVIGVYDNGQKECIEVRTIRRKTCFSYDHPILTYRPFKAKKGAAWTVRNNAKLKWIEAGKLQKNDWIIVTRDLKRDKKFLNPDAIKFLGAFLGDGHIHKDMRHLFLCFLDQSKREKYSEHLRKGFGYSNKITYHNTHGMMIYSNKLAKKIDRYGLNKLSPQKEVPSWVFSLRKGLKKAFIEGYTDADGYSVERINRNYKLIHFAASSEKLIKQLHFLLNLLGEQVSNIKISNRTKPIIIKEKLVKNAKPLFRFDWYCEGKRNKNSHLTIKNPHKTFNLSKKFSFEKVLEVKPAGKKQTFNLETWPDRTFFVNGIATHNSGFVLEVLQAVGIVPHGYDTTANGLYQRFSENFSPPGPGMLVFWLNLAGRATHVEMMIDESHTIGASGGGQATRTAEDAASQNAFIKIRPLEYRGSHYVILDPFKDIE